MIILNPEEYTTPYGELEDGDGEDSGDGMEVKINDWKFLFTTLILDVSQS